MLTSTWRNPLQNMKERPLSGVNSKHVRGNAIDAKPKNPFPQLSPADPLVYTDEQILALFRMVMTDNYKEKAPLYELRTSYSKHVHLGKGH